MTIVIPVMDILEGRVVWAKHGDRASYKPLISWLCKTADPIELIANFSRLGFNRVYVADLDAILGRKVNYSIYGQLLKYSHIMLDNGVKTIENIDQLINLGINEVIVSTESSPTMNFILSSLDKFTAKKLVISIDTYNGKIISKIKELRDLNPIDSLKLFKDYGFEKAIFLDLKRVGSYSGVDIKIIEKMVGIDINLIVGGGIRNINDILLLRKLGLYGVLIASALHERKISINELRRYDLI